MASAVISSRVVNIADLRELARRRLPRVVFDYIDGGADGEVTLRENCRVFDDVMFRPRSAVALDKVDLRTSVIGHHLALPFLLAPVGSTRMFWPRGEAVASKAAGAAGTAYILSTLSGTRLEEVKAASSGPCWYQVYLCGGRDVAMATIARAQAAGYSALVVTIDTPVAGLRERDLRNGTREILTRDPWAMAPFVGQFLARPRWLKDFLADGGLMNFPNIMLPDGPMGYADVGAALESSVVCWNDLRWIRDAWSGPIVIKGVHTADDARRAVDAGASAIVVSNHGGRQRADRGAVRRRNPPRRRHREGALPWRARGARRPRVRVRSWRGRRSGRHARDRHPAHGPGAHDEAARVCGGVGAGSFVRGGRHALAGALRAR